MLSDIYKLIGLDSSLSSLTCNDVPYDKHLVDKFKNMLELYLYNDIGIPSVSLSDPTIVIPILDVIECEATRDRIKVLYALYQVILLGIPENVGVLATLPLLRQYESMLTNRECKITQQGTLSLPNNKVLHIANLEKVCLLLSKFIDVFGEKAQMTEHGFLYVPNVYNTPYYLKLVRDTGKCCISNKPTIFSQSLQLNKKLLKTVEVQINDILIAYEISTDSIF